MKRILCLCLVLLLLSACEAPVTQETTEATIPYVPYTPFEDLEIRFEDGSVTEGYSDWAWFVQDSKGHLDSKITLISTYEGKTYTSVLAYADGVYTITEEDMVRSYPYLVYSCVNLPEGAKGDFAEYYLLSEDPEMTMDRYHRHLVSSVLQEDFPRTQIVYMDFLSFDRAESYGDVPAEYRENLALLVGASFCEEGFYVERLLSEPEPASSALTETVRKCYNYDFRPLPDDSLPESSVYGYYRGEAVGQNNSYFNASAEDRLPAHIGEDFSFALYPGGIWQEGEGYVLLRYHHMGHWPLQHPSYSYVPSYCELILTYYDENGQPQWQTVSDIFVR